MTNLCLTLLQHPVRCVKVPRPFVHYEAQDRDDAVLRQSTRL
jgi:hypothetical protein